MNRNQINPKTYLGYKAEERPEPLGTCWPGWGLADSPWVPKDTMVSLKCSHVKMAFPPWVRMAV